MEGNTSWLAVMAIATAVQSIVVVGAAIAAVTMSRRASNALGRFEREELAPLVKRMHVALDRIESIAGRVETADDNVREAIQRTGDTVARAASTLGSTLWPVLGLGRGAIAALAAFTARRQARPRPGRIAAIRPTPRALHEDELKRFVYEGGN